MSDSTQDQPFAQRTLAAALRDCAVRLSQVLDDAETAHAQYAHATETAWSWRRMEQRIGSEFRHRRTEASLRLARVLISQLRDQADEAADQFPKLTVSGAVTIPAPESTDPTAVARWWADLSAPDRDEVLITHTGWLGRADGIPVQVRHRANLINLDRAQQRLTTVAEEDPDELTQARARQDLQGLELLSDLFDGHDFEGHDQDLPTYLYLLDTREYPLRAAVLQGELGEATHVVVQIPGTTTTVATRLHRELAWLRALRQEAAHVVPDTSGLVTLDWIGYHAPMELTSRRGLGDSRLRWLVPGDAADASYAREAAPLLGVFADGLRLLAPPSARLVGMGHSYGGTVLGLALTMSPAFDAAIAIGCPGIFARTTQELRLAPESFYVFQTPTDLIPRLGVFGPELTKVTGAQLLSPVARLSTDHDRTRRWLRPAIGHEDYYSPGTVSLNALAAIAMGQPAKVKTVSAAKLAKVERTMTKDEHDHEIRETS